MSIHVAKSAGFCFGVNRAVELVEQAAREKGRVCTLGPIIHNRHAVAHFQEMGVSVIESRPSASARLTISWIRFTKGQVASTISTPCSSRSRYT